MEKHVIKVPKGIRYIGDWEGFYDEFPNCPHIMDKTITGCGFTEWCLTNSENVILCSPRLMLIDNKANQHKGELMVVKGSGVDLGVDIDLEGKPNTEGVKEFLTKLQKSREVSKDLMTNLQDGLNEYRSIRKERPLKIITTYDSFPIVKDLLKFNGLLDKFHVYVDEFQSIFTDSRFKVDTESRFLDSLQNLAPCYVSATPMMENYLDKIPEFSNLPYIELDWETEDVSRIVRPDLKIKSCRSIITAANEVIQTYLSGNFERVIIENKVVESREATLFVNSVNNIITIIRKTKLTPDQVNILCARTEENLNKIKKKLGKNFTIGSVPLSGESRKMITICTRTVYLGADFYSDNSRTFIFSDANIETLSVDISLDLPQIMGRQRLNSNPWKNCAEFYYKTLFKDGDDKRKITQALINKKIENTQLNTDLLEKTYTDKEKERLVYLLKFNIIKENYKTSYLSLSLKDGEDKFTFNNLVFISEQRAFDIQNIDYADRFVMFNTIDKVLHTNTTKLGKEISDFWKEYKKLTRMEDKLRMICESNLSKEASEQIESMVELSVRNYLSLGKEKLKACGYQHLKKLIASHTNKLSIDLDSIIYSNFKEGTKISKKDLKTKIADIYSSNGITDTAKASDIGKWFEVKPCTINLGGKRINGLELIKRKS